GRRERGAGSGSLVFWPRGARPTLPVRPPPGPPGDPAKNGWIGRRRRAGPTTSLPARGAPPARPTRPADAGRLRAAGGGRAPGRAAFFLDGGVADGVGWGRSVFVAFRAC